MTSGFQVPVLSGLYVMGKKLHLSYMHLEDRNGGPSVVCS